MMQIAVGAVEQIFSNTLPVGFDYASFCVNEACLQLTDLTGGLHVDFMLCYAYVVTYIFNRTESLICVHV